MLSKEERDFIHYWQQNRLRRKKTVRQFLLGIPIGLLFVIPIVINFTSGWYKRAAVEAGSQDFDPRVLFVALLLIVAFIAIFYQRHKWDQYEQRYLELLAREARSGQDVPGNNDAPGNSDAPTNSDTPDSRETSDVANTVSSSQTPPPAAPATETAPDGANAIPRPKTQPADPQGTAETDPPKK